MNSLVLELSLEQEFALTMYMEQVAKSNQDEAQEFLIEVLSQSMIKDNVIRSLVKFELG